MDEFNHHRAAIVGSIAQNVTLSDKHANLPLDGIMLSPVVPHDASDESISHLTVMGRFALANTKGSLRFQAGLFGEQSAEQRLKITATRQSDNQEHVFELTPATPAEMLFADNT